MGVVARAEEERVTGPVNAPRSGGRNVAVVETRTVSFEVVAEKLKLANLAGALAATR
jgi:hypothetical protein